MINMPEICYLCQIPCGDWRFFVIVSSGNRGVLGIPELQ